MSVFLQRLFRGDLFICDCGFAPAASVFSFVLPSLTYLCFVGRESVTDKYGPEGQVTLDN